MSLKAFLSIVLLFAGNCAFSQINLNLGEFTYRNGVEHGEYKMYHPNGKLQQQGTYTYGKEYDAPKKWNEKGQLIGD